MVFEGEFDLLAVVQATRRQDVQAVKGNGDSAFCPHAPIVRRMRQWSNKAGVGLSGGLFRLPPNSTRGSVGYGEMVLLRGR